MSTHEDHEDQPQEEAQTHQQERNQDQDLLHRQHPPQLLGRRVVDQRALMRPDVLKHTQKGFITTENTPLCVCVCVRTSLR